MMNYTLKQQLGGFLLLLSSISISVGFAHAQVGFSLKASGGKTLEITGRDIPRNDNSLILYTSDFGESTRTNPFGVEVVAIPFKEKPDHYHVLQISSIWDCDKQNNRSQCGNVAIPEDGIVLSAAGEQRQPLLQALPIGTVFALQHDWFQQRSTALTITNPTPQSNPLASGFPGYRASHQLIRYDQAYGQPTTGTNEFGFEVTIVNGVVVAQEGANSTIPTENGFVLSGHGKARDWLIANAPLGANIQISEDGKTLTSIIDLNTYRTQLAQRMQEAQSRIRPKLRRELGRDTRKIETLQATGQPEAGAQLATDTLEKLNRALWSEYPAYPPEAIKAAWHRPVEKNVTEVGQKLDSLKKAGLNTVFLETFFHGYPIFPSKTYVDYQLPNQNPKFAGWDPLQAWVNEAHKRGMKVEIWFQTFYAGTTAFQAPGPILSHYPEWTNVQYSALEKTNPTPSTVETGSYFLDPANPQVQTFLLKLIGEIVSRYPVDGFQLDYIRYPASFPPDRFSYLKTTWGYTATARKLFQQQTGVDPATLSPEQTDLWATWNQFKVKQVSQFVQQASELLRKTRSTVQVSAAVFPSTEASLIQKHQDWKTWAQNGWVDFLAPMTLSSAIKVVKNDTQNMVAQVGPKVPVITGVFGPFNQNTAENLLEQLDGAKQGGASGFSIFDTAHLSGRMLQALQASQQKE